MSGGIYFIKCEANDFTYVGSTKDFEKRFSKHRSDLLRNSHVNPHLQNAFNKYGEDSFVFVKAKELGEYEKSYYFYEENLVITNLQENRFPLFNIAKAEGGWSHATFEQKQEISKKISDSLKETMSKLSDQERKEKFGKGKKGIPISDERKEHLSKIWKDRPKSEETKRKMSEAQKSSVHNKEAGRRVGKSNKGKIPPNIRSVEVDGIKFNTIKDAAEHFKISSSAIIKRIQRGKNAKYL